MRQQTERGPELRIVTERLRHATGRVEPEFEVHVGSVFDDELWAIVLAVLEESDLDLRVVRGGVTLANDGGDEDAGVAVVFVIGMGRGAMRGRAPCVPADVPAGS